jgi:hypothetical protein
LIHRERVNLKNKTNINIDTQRERERTLIHRERVNLKNKTNMNIDRERGREREREGERERERERERELTKMGRRGIQIEEGRLMERWCGTGRMRRIWRGLVGLRRWGRRPCGEMSLGMLCVRDGRKMREERRKSGLAIVGERK